MSESIWGDDAATLDAVDAILSRVDSAGEVNARVRAWLVSQRWFRGKSRALEALRVLDVAPLGEARVCVLEAIFDAGPSERYVAVFALARGRPGEPEIARAHEGALIDALAREDVLLALLDGVARGTALTTRARAVLRCEASAAFHAEGHASGARPAKVLAAEQSNTSIRYGDRWLMKLVRKLDEGTSVELEISRFLSERAGFAHAPILAGSIAYEPRGAAEPETVAILQGWRASLGDGWTLAVEDARRALAPEPPPPTFVARLTRLGQRTAQLHRALASDVHDPAFAPEPFDAAALSAFASRQREALAQTFAKLAGHALEAELAPLRPRAEARLDALLAVGDAGARIRVHGDYHLGQVLVAPGEDGDDFVILDFEGEPARPLAERRAKRSPLADVAGMLRSLHYAAMSARGEGVADPGPAEAWARSAQAAFLTAYLGAMDGAGVLPAPCDLGPILDAHLLDKCLYELRYELDNRPAWVAIPAAGLRALLT